MKKTKAIVLGSMNFDCVGYVNEFPQKGQTIEGISFNTFSGGKGANQAVQLSLLGSEVSFIGCAGNDSSGEILIRTLRSYGINVDNVKMSDDLNTGACQITVDIHGNNIISYFPGANKFITTRHIDQAAEVFKNADIFITQNEVNLEAVEYALKKAKEYNVLTILNPAPAIELPHEVFNYVDYLIPNELEAETYTGIQRCNMKMDEWLERVVAWFLNIGVKNIIITMGEKGAYYSNGIQQAYVPAYKINPVDTTAAGDAFIGGFSFALSENRSIVESMKLGCACGAFSVQHKGAQISLGKYADIKVMLESLCKDQLPDN